MCPVFLYYSCLTTACKFTGWWYQPFLFTDQSVSWLMAWSVIRLAFWQPALNIGDDISIFWMIEICEMTTQHFVMQVTCKRMYKILWVLNKFVCGLFTTFFSACWGQAYPLSTPIGGGHAFLNALFHFFFLFFFTLQTCNNLQVMS